MACACIILCQFFTICVRFYNARAVHGQATFVRQTNSNNNNHNWMSQCVLMPTTHYRLDSTRARVTQCKGPIFLDLNKYGYLAVVLLQRCCYQHFCERQSRSAWRQWTRQVWARRPKRYLKKVFFFMKSVIAINGEMHSLIWNPHFCRPYHFNRLQLFCLIPIEEDKRQRSEAVQWW